MSAMAPIVPLPLPPVWLLGDVASSAGNRGGRRKPSKGIIVDLDDTLYPRRRFVQSGFAAIAAYVARRFDVPSDEAFTVLSECASRGEGHNAFQALCRTFHLDAATIPVLVDVFRHHRPNIFLGRGARDMLLDLRAGGWRVAVLTNGLPSVQTRKVEALGLGALVDHVVYAEQVTPGGKPSPAAFTAALERLGTSALQTVALGDDPERDIAGARAIGVGTIRLALPGVTVTPGYDADVVVDMLTEVPRAAASLLQGVARHVA